MTYFHCNGNYLLSMSNGPFCKLQGEGLVMSTSADIDNAIAAYTGQTTFPHQEDVEVQNYQSAEK